MKHITKLFSNQRVKTQAGRAHSSRHRELTTNTQKHTNAEQVHPVYIPEAIRKLGPETVRYVLNLAERLSNPKKSIADQAHEDQNRSYGKAELNFIRETMKKRHHVDIDHGGAILGGADAIEKVTTAIGPDRIVNGRIITGDIFRKMRFGDLMKSTNILIQLGVSQLGASHKPINNGFPLGSGSLFERVENAIKCSMTGKGIFGLSQYFTTTHTHAQSHGSAKDSSKSVQTAETYHSHGAKRFSHRDTIYVIKPTMEIVRDLLYIFANVEIAYSRAENFLHVLHPISEGKNAGSFLITKTGEGGVDQYFIPKEIAALILAAITHVITQRDIRYDVTVKDGKIQNVALVPGFYSLAKINNTTGDVETSCNDITNHDNQYTFTPLDESTHNEHARHTDHSVQAVELSEIAHFIPKDVAKRFEEYQDGVYPYFDDPHVACAIPYIVSHEDAMTMTHNKFGLYHHDKTEVKVDLNKTLSTALNHKK